MVAPVTAGPWWACNKQKCRSEEHTSELQSHHDLVCRLLLEKKKFQIISGNYNPEYGRAAGGVVNILSRSGTNNFLDDAFIYYRDNAFDATNALSTVPERSFT